MFNKLNNIRRKALIHNYECLSLMHRMHSTCPLHFATNHFTTESWSHCISFSPTHSLTHLLTHFTIYSRYETVSYQLNPPLTRNKHSICLLHHSPLSTTATLTPTLTHTLTHPLTTTLPTPTPTIPYNTIESIYIHGKYMQMKCYIYTNRSVSC